VEILASLPFALNGEARLGCRERGGFTSDLDNECLFNSRHGNPHHRRRADRPGACTVADAAGRAREDYVFVS
jgi:hypothetical protein